MWFNKKMIYCQRCGVLNEDEANFCSKCGSALKEGLTPATISVTGKVSEEKKGVSGLAIAALVCGIFGFCCCPSGIAAIIMGAIERSNIAEGKSPKEGLTLATVGLWLGIISVALSIIWWIIYSFVMELLGELPKFERYYPKF